MNARNPWLNLLLGTLLGAGMVVSEVAARRVDRLTAEHEQTDNARSDHWREQLEQATAKVGAATARAEACEDKLNTQVALNLGKSEVSTVSGARAEETRNPVDDARWYTLVYVPAPANQPAQPLELLNLVRPGLGTMLSKLTAQPAQQGARLEAILDGRVKGVAVPQGMHLVWTMQTPELPGGN